MHKHPASLHYQPRNNTIQVGHSAVLKSLPANAESCSRKGPPPSQVAVPRVEALLLPENRGSVRVLAGEAVSIAAREASFLAKQSWGGERTGAHNTPQAISPLLHLTQRRLPEGGAGRGE